MFLVVMLQIKDEFDDDFVELDHGMMDHSRMALCVFMLALVTFNPFGLVMNKYAGPSSDFSTVVEGRTILNVNSKLSTFVVSPELCTILSLGLVKTS